MRTSKVRKVWQDGGIALGTLVKSIDPVHSETLSQMGFDFLWYDLEHSDKSVETFGNLARTCRVGNVDILARPARWEYMRMARLLEAGATGILYPRCESAEEAKEVVRWSKFHPMGERGFDGGSSDNNYGQYPADDYTNQANENTWITAQVESPEALNKVDEIASVDGIDCVFFGPGDYSALTGRPGDVRGKETIDAARITAEQTLQAGKIFGTLVFDLDHAEQMKDLGAQLLVHGADIVFYKKAYTDILNSYQGIRQPCRSTVLRYVHVGFFQSFPKRCEPLHSNCQLNRTMLLFLPVRMVRLSLLYFILYSALLAQPKQPNVLFIAIDDLNDWVGFMGGYPGEVKTPNIDRLARMGTAFTNAHTASPVCCPSRVAVLSGQLPSTSGIYNNRHWWKPNLPELVTIPAHFRNNGYTVVGAGKIFHHTAGNNPPESWDDFQRLDFHDDAFARPRRDLFPYLTDQNIPEGFPFSGIKLYSDEVDWAGLDKPESEFDDARAAQYVIDFLQRHHRSPFFLACGFFRPHMPWYFPRKYLDLYPLDEVKVPADFPEDLDDVPEAGKQLALRKYVDMQKTRDAGKWPLAIQHYLASISFMDAQLGRLLDALESSLHASNTVIILWSDHGWHLGEKQHWHKRTLWEESTRVPLVVVAPQLGKTGQVCSQPASLLDVFPTLIDLCGLPSPSNQPLDGISLKPWIADPEKIREHSAITVHELKHVSVRSERYRYIRYHDGSEELYDLSKDPNEWDNQIGNPALTAIRNKLASELPTSFAPDALPYTRFEFDPHTYTWTNKATGKVTKGRP